MTHRTRFAVMLAAALVTAAAWTFAFAGGTTSDLTLNGFEPGQAVTGPAVKTDDLKGKVVVVEYWGDQCPICAGTIKHLCTLQAKYGRDKVIVVANQVWTKDVKAADRAWKHKATNDQVSVINHGKIAGANVRGVPHVFVFDTKGREVWNGFPSPELDKAVANALPSNA